LALGRHIVVRVLVLVVEEGLEEGLEAVKTGFLEVCKRIRSMIVSSRAKRPAKTNISTNETKRKRYLSIETKKRRLRILLDDHLDGPVCFQHIRRRGHDRRLERRSGEYGGRAAERFRQEASVSRSYERPAIPL